MKQEDEFYEKWVAELRKNQPKLDNSDKLMAAILKQVSRTISERKRRVLLVGVWISGIAATVLLCVFVNNIYFAPVTSPTKKQDKYECWQKSYFMSLPEEWNEMKLLEKNSYLSLHYAQCRQFRQARITELTKNTFK